MSISPRCCALSRLFAYRMRWLSVALFLFSGPLAFAQSGNGMAQTDDATGYREPVDVLKAIVDAPRAPDLNLGPRGDLAALLATPGLPDIASVAQPELRLAGLRIHPGVHAQSQFNFSHDLWLLDVATGRDIRIDGLPEHPAIAGIAWSPDQRYLAFRNIDSTTGGNELWVVEIATRTARRLLANLNTVAGAGLSA